MACTWYDYAEIVCLVWFHVFEWVSVRVFIWLWQSTSILHWLLLLQHIKRVAVRDFGAKSADVLCEVCYHKMAHICRANAFEVMYVSIISLPMSCSSTDLKWCVEQDPFAHFPIRVFFPVWGLLCAAFYSTELQICWCFLQLRYDLPASYKFHKQKEKDIAVDLWRFTKWGNVGFKRSRNLEFLRFSLSKSRFWSGCRYSLPCIVENQDQ